MRTDLFIQNESMNTFFIKFKLTLLVEMKLNYKLKQCLFLSSKFNGKIEKKSYVMCFISRKEFVRLIMVLSI